MMLHKREHLRANLESPTIAIFFLAALIIFGASVYLFNYSTGDHASARVLQGAAVQESLADPFVDISLDAKAAYVLDLKSGRTLYARNPDVQLPLASITKVPLAIAVSEVLSPDAAIKIPKDTSPPGSEERLAAGDIWRIKDILTFTLVASSNGGADILSEAADPLIRAKYGDVPASNATIWRMNRLAQELKLHNTYFINPSGLDESLTLAGSYSSARDVAALFAYASAKWPAVFASTARDGLLLTSVRGGTTAAFNTNEALGSISGLIMGKTGFTDLAGGNLAIVYDIGPAHPVIAVVLGSTQEGRFEDMKKIVKASYGAVALAQ